MFSLNGRRAVVIGGTSGIGRAIALALADAGADVVASARSEDAVDATAQEIEARGRKTMRETVNILDRSSVDELERCVRAELGPVDILVNSAGMTKRVPTIDCPEDLWDQIMDINLKGTLYGCQAFGRGMIERGYGKIINIASLSTYVAFHEVTPYGASKAAVGALTRSLAVEWAEKGVCVNAIAPGIIPTALNRSIIETPRGKELLVRTPMERFGTPEEMGGAAVYLASEESDFVTGEILAVDGGFLASGVNTGGIYE